MFDILNEMPPDPGWSRPLPRGTTGTSWLYPIMIILGFAVAIALSCIKMKKRYKITIEPFYWFILIGVPTAIFGANFGSCVLGEPAGKPWSEFFTRFGEGLAIEWGVMFTVIAAFIYFPLILRKTRYKVRDDFGEQPAVKQVSMWLYFDAVMPCILLAQFLGRWGNYFNQEVYGAPVTNENLAWFLYRCLPGMWISNPGGGLQAGWYQPLFLWEGIGNLVMFFVLYIGVEFIKVRKAGDMAASYLIWYGLFRACLEPLRNQQFKSTTSIVLSIVFVVIGVLFIVLNHVFGKKYREYRGFKTLFSRFGGYYICRVFEPKPRIENREKNIARQTKIVQACENKIDLYKGMLENELTDLNNETILKKRDKTTRKIELWERRLHDSEARLENVEKGICTWDFPKDYHREESEKIYYNRY